jgi:hypothetical protein
MIMNGTSDIPGSNILAVCSVFLISGGRINILMHVICGSFEPLSSCRILIQMSIIHVIVSLIVHEEPQEESHNS